jgi:hypothetical protein
MMLPKRWKSWAPAAADRSAAERWVLWGRSEQILESKEEEMRHRSRSPPADLSESDLEEGPPNARFAGRTPIYMGGIDHG